jgi:hypothetical protein
MQSFPELTRSLYALQANSWFFSAVHRACYDRDKKGGATVKWVGRGAEPNDGDW